MTTQDLYNLLIAQAANNSVIFNDQIFSAAQISQIQHSFGLSGDNYLTIESTAQADIPKPVGNTITLTKGGIALFNATSAEINVVFTVDQNDVDVIIQVSMSSDWSFNSSFPSVDFFPFNDTQNPFDNNLFIYSSTAQSGFVPSFTVYAGKKLELVVGLNYVNLLSVADVPVLSTLLSASNLPTQVLFSGLFSGTLIKSYPSFDLKCQLATNVSLLPGITFNAVDLRAKMDAASQGIPSFNFGLDAQTDEMTYFIALDQSAETATFFATGNEGKFPTLSSLGNSNLVKSILPNGVDFSSYLPTVVKDAFGSIDFQQASFSFLISQKKVMSIVFTVGQDSSKPITISGFTFTNLTLQASWENGGAQSTASIAFNGSASIGLNVFSEPFFFDLKVSNSSGSWEIDEIEAQYQSIILLKDLITEISPGITVPDIFSEVFFGGASLTAQPSASIYSGKLSTHFGLTMLGQDFSSNIALSFSKGKSGFNFDISGGLYVDTIYEFTFNTEFGSTTKLLAKWQKTDKSSLTINQILESLGLSAIQIPSGISLALGLQSVQLTYDALSDEVSMLVTTTDNLDAYFVTTKVGGLQKYCFAVSLDHNYNLSDLSTHLGFLDSITLNQLSVVIADFTDANFQIPIPNLSYTGVVEGVALRTLLTMTPTASASGGFKEIINFMESSFSDTVVQAEVDLSSSSFALKGSVTTHLDFPSSKENYLTLEKVTLSIQNNPIKLSLGCNALLNYDFKSNPEVKQLDLMGQIYLEENAEGATIGASLSESTTVSQPFGISVVSFGNLGVGIEASGGELSGIAFTVQGDVAIASPESQQPINESLGASIAFEDDVVNIPYFSSKTKGDITFQKLWNALFPKVNFPDFVNAFELSELDFYFCDQQEVLPDGSTVYPGISFLAASTIWNFSSYINLQVSAASNKIAGKMEIDPINLTVKGTNIASVTGQGKGDSKYNIQPGGAVIDFDTSTESFAATVDANIMGMQEGIDASISKDGFSIKFSQSLPAGIASDSVDVMFDSITDMSFSASLNVGVNCTPNLSPFGTIHIDDSINGSIAVSLKGTSFSAVVNGSFTWMGQTISLVNIDISENLTSLAELAGALISYIEHDVENLFSEALSHVETYVKAVAQGAITGGEFILNVLYNTYQVSVTDLFSTLSDLPNGFHLDGKLNFALDIAPGIPSKQIHADLGHMNAHADAGHGDVGHFDHSPLPSIHGDLGHADGPHGDVNVSTGFSTPGFNVTLLNYGVNQHFDITVPPTVHADAPSPHADVNPHFDIGIGGASFNAGGSTKVNSQVGLSDIKFDLKFSGTARAQFTVGTPHLSQHFDAGHFDHHQDVFGVGPHENIHGDLGHADVGSIGAHGDTGAQHLDQSL